jgi:peptide/nickel transport system substrate-binding protein
VKSKLEKIELAIIVLVLIGIIVSSGTMYYMTTAIGNLSTLTSDVTTLTESVTNLTSTISNLTSIMAEGFEEYAEALAALTARLAAIEAGLAEKETLIVGTTDSVEKTLDPAQAYDYFGWCILQQIGGTLVSVEPGSPKGSDFLPDLAVNWSSNEDLDIWDFNLREGVTFSDGTEFNATHVKYSFDRAIALIPSIPEGAPAGLGYDAIINRTEVLDTYKVRFHLKMSFSPFLGILASRSSTIVNPQYAPIVQINHTTGDARASTPVAFAGPYVLSKWNRVAGRDVEVKLDANPNYWDLASGYPKMEHVIFRFYSDAATLRLAIEAGDVDMAYRHTSPTDVLDLEDNPNVKVWWGTGAQIQYFCFQQKRAPFNDTRVRVAVTAALNRTAVCETVFLGLSDPLYSIIPPGMLGHTEAFQKLGDANYTLTTSLLAAAGYDATNKLEFDLWYESSGHYPMSAEQALLYKEALEASGVITVTLKYADWASYKQNRDNEIMDAYIYGWYPDYVDPDNYAFLYWASWLHTNYNNQTQVDLYNQARATTNTTLREELYAQIDAMAVEQCSVIPLWVGSGWAVTTPPIYGIYLDITQDMRYWLIYK